MSEADEKSDKTKGPSGIFGFLVRLRNSGVLARMPAAWVKVMVVLYSHRNPQGFAWPAQRTLAAEAGVDRRTVRKFINWAKAGLGIRIFRKKYNNYFLPVDDPVDPWMPSIAKGRKRAGEHPEELGQEKMKNGRNS